MGIVVVVGLLLAAAVAVVAIAVAAHRAGHVIRGADDWLGPRISPDADAFEDQDWRRTGTD